MGWKAVRSYLMVYSIVHRKLGMNPSQIRRKKRSENYLLEGCYLEKDLVIIQHLTSLVRPVIPVSSP